MARLLNEKLQRVIDKQTEHTITLANHTASLDRLEKPQEQVRAALTQHQETLTETLNTLRNKGVDR
jgi:hypothetical protein